MTSEITPQPETHERSWKGKVRHGTISGHRKHTEEGTMCVPCFEAKKAYDAERKDVPRHRMRARGMAKAQSVALARLKAAHPDEYRRYYEEAKDEVLPIYEAMAEPD